MRRPWLDLLLVLLLGAAGFAVWSGQQRKPDPFLNTIKSRGVLRVGIDPSYPPFDVTANGQITGYDAALSRFVASDLGVRLLFVPMALDTMYDALSAGKVDVLVSALPFAPERQKDVLFSQPYYQAGQVLLVSAGNNSIAGVRDLDNKRIGVELGSNADTEARLLARTYVTMRVMSVYHSPDEAMDALTRGEEDAVITDATSAHQYMDAHAGALNLLSPNITDEPYVIAMPFGAFGLADSVNATIERLRSSGELSTMMGITTK